MSSRTFKILSSTVAAVALLLTIAAVASPSAYSGQWFIGPSDTSGDVQVELRYSRHTATSNWNTNQSWDAPMAALQGLTPAVLDSSGSHGQFRLVRDAGTFVCDGWFSGGKGSGTFTFEANPQFVAELHKRGVTGDVSEEQQFRMAMANTSLELVDTLKAAKYEFDAEDLIRVSNHGVTLAYIKEINALGYHPSTLGGLVRMRDHGVTADYVKAIQASGLKDLSEEQVVRLRDHGVSADYIHELSVYGITDLSAEQLTRLRDHGVTPDFISAVRKAGYNASPEELTKLRDHGVSADFVAAVKKAGLDASASDLARLRDHGVSADFIADVRAAGFNDLSVNDLTRLRDHGVDAQYLKQHGKGRSINDIIRMHDRGGENEVL